MMGEGGGIHCFFLFMYCVFFCFCIHNLYLIYDHLKTPLLSICYKKISTVYENYSVFSKLSGGCQYILRGTRDCSFNCYLRSGSGFDHELVLPSWPLFRPSVNGRCKEVAPMRRVTPMRRVAPMRRVV